MRVYYPKPFDDQAVPRLIAAVGSAAEILSGDQPSDYEILIAGRPTEEMMSAPSLKAVLLPFAGVPAPTLELLKKNPRISGHNLHHNASDTAEMAVALMFAAAKIVIPLDQSLRKDDWGQNEQEERAIALEAKTALILGFGQIGQRIARMLVAVGMKVLATNRTGAASGIEGVETFAANRLHELLPRANVLVLALPMTADTTGLIGAKELALLPKDAVLVNIARGAIVEEEALFNALKSGHLHSAGLDVWYQYPKESDSKSFGNIAAPSAFPFGTLENVVMSPHRGGTSADTEPHRIRGLAEIITAIANGVAAPNRIDLDAGY